MYIHIARNKTERLQLCPSERQPEQLDNMSSESTLNTEPMSIDIGRSVKTVQEILCSEEELEGVKKALLELADGLASGPQIALEALPPHVHRLSVLLTPSPAIFMKEEANGQTVQVTFRDRSSVHQRIDTIRLYLDTDFHDPYYDVNSCTYTGGDQATINISGKAQPGNPSRFTLQAVDEF